MSSNPAEAIMRALAERQPELVEPDDWSAAIEYCAAAEIPAEQAEGATAVCMVCRAATSGTWQHELGGRRVRTPTEHFAPPGLVTCPGSFRPADLYRHH